MCTADELEVVALEEIDQHVGTKGVGDPSFLIVRKPDLPFVVVRG